ncbi:cyanophycinase [Phycisphaeraceae bacterium D3-23]
MQHRLNAIAALLLLLPLLGCTGRATVALPPRAPTLLIIGGGSLGETPIRPAFLQAVHSDFNQPGNVLVLPTASGAPEESGLGTTLALRDITTRHEVGVLMLTVDDPGRADDDAAAQKIRIADGIWFTGGDQSRITHVFRPPGTQGLADGADTTDTPQGPSLADQALRAMFDRGGTIAGTSAGAAMMSNPMIAGGSSDNALLHGQGEEGVLIAPGMGLFTFGLIDQHFLQRGRLGRLIAALEATNTRYGFGIEEGKAVVVTLGDTPDLTALGPDRALIVNNPSGLRNDNGDRHGIRLSLLGTGDRWDPLAQHAVPHPSKQDRAQITIPLDGPAHDPTRNAWEPGAIRDLIHALAVDPDTPLALTSEHFVLIFSCDRQTRFFVEPDNRGDLFADNLLLEVRRRIFFDDTSD